MGSFQCEEIAVVVIPQCFEGGVEILLPFLGKPIDSGSEICNQLVFAPSADVCIFTVERDVVEVVEVAENADLVESGHSRDEGEADILIHALQVAEEAFQDALVLLKQFDVVLYLKQRFVILVDQDSHLTSRMPVGGFNKGSETPGNSYVVLLSAIDSFMVSQKSVEEKFKTVFKSEIFGVEVEPQHRSRSPVEIHRVGCEASEEITSSLEISLEGREQ